MEKLEIVDKPTRRVKWFAVSPQILVEFLSGRTFRVANDAIPNGAKVWRADYDLLTDSIRIGVEHPSFEEVPEYQIPPRVEVWLTEIRDEVAA